MRIFVAGLIAAIALGGGLALHNYKLETQQVRGGTRVYLDTERDVRGAWQDPAAVALAVVGLGAAGGIIFSRRRRHQAR
jgi:hypothetical protein